MRKILGITVAFVMTPSIALADGLNMPNDPGINYLAQIFGSALFPGSAGQTTALMAAMPTFITAVLAIAAAYFTWNLISGVTQTAHSGEVLGQTWSSLWVPIRFVAAASMMVPVGGGGTILLQQIVALLIKTGLNLGLATAYLAGGSILVGSPITVAAPPSVETIAEQAWKMAACNATIAQYGLEAGAATPPDISTGVVNGTAMVWSVPTQNRQDGANCGAITYGAPQGANAAVGNAWNNAVTGLLNNLQPLANQAVLASRPDAPDGTVSPTPGQIAAAVKAAQSQLNADIATATTSVISALQSSPSTASTNGSIFGAMAGGGTIATQLETCGWMCFGAAYNTLAEANSAFSQAVNTQPAAASANVATGSAADENNEDTRPGLLLTKQLWDLHTNPAQANWQPPAGGGYGAYAGAQSSAAASTSSGGIGGWIQEKIWSKIQGFSGSLTALFAGNWLATFADGAGPNPLARLSGLGSTVRAASIDFQLALSVLSAVDVSGAVGRFLGSGIGSVLQMSLSGMLGAGTFLVDILPLLPAAMWFFGVIGWLILAAEALIAAPLWAFSHLHPTGDGIHGQAGDGYMIVLNIMMRPTLMVLGMIAGMGIFSVGVNYLAQLMSIAIMDATSQGATGQAVAAASTLGISLLISWAAKFIFLVVLMTGLAILSFGMIHKLPDQVMRWIGGAINGDAYGASDAADNAHSKTTAIVGTVKGGAPRLPHSNKDRPEKPDEDKPGIEPGGGNSIQASKALPQGESGPG